MLALLLMMNLSIIIFLEVAPGPITSRLAGENLGNSYTLTWTELTGADDGFESNDASAEAKAITEDVVTFGVAVG